MKTKLGSTILIGLLYAQAGFGLLAVGAVAMKDRADSSARGATAVEIAAASVPLVR